MKLESVSYLAPNEMSKGKLNSYIMKQILEENIVEFSYFKALMSSMVATSHVSLLNT